MDYLCECDGKLRRPVGNFIGCPSSAIHGVGIPLRPGCWNSLSDFNGKVNRIESHQDPGTGEQPGFSYSDDR